MKTINQLTKDVIAHIAAGQVVDGPASVVKELVENSLDSGAHSITVELERGGMDRIIVTDDGAGMSKEDLAVSFLPHTTSKINLIDDISHITSFGFRGEALASIATVARLHIQSKQKDAVQGYHIDIKADGVSDVMPIGMPDGTRIIVEQLFENVPARKKFLKSVSSELQKCLDIVRQLAIQYADVSFIVIHNDQELLRTMPYDSDLDRFSQLLSKEFAHHALPLDYLDGHVRITGYVAKPEISKAHDRYQHVFVNKRPVQNKDIKKAVKKAFGSLLEPRIMPQFVLNIEHPHEYVDINIDPKKSTVSFHSPIDKHVVRAVESVLQEYDLTYAQTSGNDMDQELSRTMKETLKAWNVKDIKDADIAQIHNLYLVVQTDAGMMLIDQHAAHERILYEQFMKEYEKKRLEGASWTLPRIEKVELNPSDAVMIDDYMSNLNSIGFRMELDGNILSVRAIPEVFKGRSVSECISDMLEEYNADIPYDTRTHKTLTYLACRSAIMAGDPLSYSERKRLLEKLLTCDAPYTCPHGRPTMISVSKSELESMFKRH